AYPNGTTGSAPGRGECNRPPRGVGRFGMAETPAPRSDAPGGSAARPGLTREQAESILRRLAGPLAAPPAPPPPAADSPPRPAAERLPAPGAGGAAGPPDGPASKQLLAPA